MNNSSSSLAMWLRFTSFNASISCFQLQFASGVLWRHKVNILEQHSLTSLRWSTLITFKLGTTSCPINSIPKSRHFSQTLSITYLFKNLSSGHSLTGGDRRLQVRYKYWCNLLCWGIPVPFLVTLELSVHIVVLFAYAYTPLFKDVMWLFYLYSI